MKILTKFYLFISLSLLFLLGGCGIWQDFTTYFNLYYNTTQSYEEALAEINNLEQGLFDLKEPEIPNSTVKKLDDVIQRGSKILQYEAESSYFEDALFMTGVAFYYKQSYAKAIRKFQELMLQENRDYDLRTKLWMARCQLQLRNFENGAGILEELIDETIQRDDNEILTEAYITLIAYHIDRQAFDDAIDEAVTLLETVDDDELKSRIAYHLGMLRLDMNESEEAAAAFETALDNSPDFETEFKSKFELAKLKKELGQREESYEMLDNLYNEGKYKEFWGDVYFEIGLLEYENGNVEKAFEIFTEVDTVYSKSEGAGRAMLLMGEIMRNDYADYDSAKYYYDRVQKSQVAPEIKEKAQVYSASVNSYLNLKKAISRTDRQIEYLNDPNAFVIDSLAYQRYLEKQREEKDELLRTQQRGRGGANIANLQKEQASQVEEGTDSTEVADSLETQPAADSLFVQPQWDFEIDEDYIVTEKPVKPTVGIDTLKNEQAANYFELGNLFFVDYQRLDSAYYYYSKLLNDFEETPNKPKVLFALGTYYESVGEQQKADSLYTVVYEDFKTYSIANEAAIKIGKPQLRMKQDPAKDLFLKAEEKLEAVKADSALSILSEITKNYPESIYAPKSIYTKGWIYENLIHLPDSALNMYAKLITDFKNSEYAKDVKDKVTMYMNEKNKRNSLDSTSVDSTSIDVDSQGLESESSRQNNNETEPDSVEADNSGAEIINPVTNEVFDQGESNSTENAPESGTDSSRTNTSSEKDFEPAANETGEEKDSTSAAADSTAIMDTTKIKTD